VAGAPALATASPERKDAMPAAPAASKARVMTAAARVLADLELPAKARHLGLYLVAVSWPHDDGCGWAAQASLADLARACGWGHPDTAKRAAGQLEAAGLVALDRGNGHRVSTWVLLSPLMGGRTGAAPGGALVQPQGAHGCTPSSVHTLSVFQEVKTPPPDPQRGGGGGVEAGQGLSPDALERFRALSRRPAWARGAWIDARTVRQLVTAPGCDAVTVAAALRAADDRRGSLRDPAGFVVSRLRDPRPDELEAERRRRDNAAAIEAQRAASRAELAAQAADSTAVADEAQRQADAAAAALGPDTVDAAIAHWIDHHAPAHLAAGLRQRDAAERRDSLTVRTYLGRILECFTCEK
jgi:hypothetical protein